jgi:FkbM family methyltransferase
MEGKSRFIESVFRRLPGFKGKRRIAKLFFVNKIKHGKDILVEVTNGCKYMLPNLSENLALDIFVNGMYEPDTHSFLLSQIPKNGIFLDIGANIGSIAIPLCKTRDDIRCVAVEASPWIFEFLKKNVDLNGLGEQINCVNKAISDSEAGQLPFYSPTDQFGKGSFSPVFTENGVMVDTISIDKLLRDLKIDRVSIIKIDIEGFEYFAFKGAPSLLAGENAPDIVFEFVDWAEDMAGREKGSAQRILKEFGYQLYTINNKRLYKSDNIIQQGNQLFFATKKELKQLTT